MKKSTKEPKCKYCYNKGYYTYASGGNVVLGDFVGDAPYNVPLTIEKRPCQRCQPPQESKREPCSCCPCTGMEGNLEKHKCKHTCQSQNFEKPNNLDSKRSKTAKGCAHIGYCDCSQPQPPEPLEWEKYFIFEQCLVCPKCEEIFPPNIYNGTFNILCKKCNDGETCVMSPMMFAKSKMNQIIASEKEKSLAEGRRLVLERVVEIIEEYKDFSRPGTDRHNETVNYTNDILEKLKRNILSESPVHPKLSDNILNLNNPEKK